MPLDPSLFVTCDHLAVACEGDRLDRQRGLFMRFAEDGIDEGLSGFNGAARQGVKVKRGIARPPDEKHLAVADDGGADCQVGTLRVVSLFGHAFYRFISLSTTSCCVYALFSSESPRDQRLQPADGVSRECCDRLRSPFGIVHCRPR